MEREQRGMRDEDEKDKAEEQSCTVDTEEILAAEESQSSVDDDSVQDEEIDNRICKPG